MGTNAIRLGRTLVSVSSVNHLRIWSAYMLLLVGFVLAVNSASAALAVADARACERSRATGEEPGCVSGHSVRARLSVAVSPSSLPIDEFVPAALSITGRFAAVGDMHPPALREARIKVDRDLLISVGGLPACRVGFRNIRRPASWLQKVCKDAIVGRGSAHFEIAFPERPAVRDPSRLTVYNGGLKRGLAFLYAVGEVNTPAATLVVTAIELQRIRKGRYGLKAVAKVPVIAGGSGSLVDFDVTLRRFFKGNSLVVARCPDTRIEIAFPKLLFKYELDSVTDHPNDLLRDSAEGDCRQDH